MNKFCRYPMLRSVVSLPSTREWRVEWQQAYYFSLTDRGPSSHNLNISPRPADITAPAQPAACSIDIEKC